MSLNFSKETLNFLTQAGQQTDPNWLNDHQNDYDTLVKRPFIALAEHLHQALQAELPRCHFPVKGIGRIKRMANKVMDGQPHYKDWLSMSASEPSKSRFESNPHLFFGILPNQAPWNGVIIAGGLYMPSGPQLKKIRSSIAADSHEFHKLFKDKAFKARFSENFSDFNKGLKVPRGFEADHPDSEWLKLKSFLVFKKLKLAEFTSPKLAEEVTLDYKQLSRVNRLLNDALAR